MQTGECQMNVDNFAKRQQVHLQQNYLKQKIKATSQPMHGEELHKRNCGERANWVLFFASM